MENASIATATTATATPFIEQCLVIPCGALRVYGLSIEYLLGVGC